MLVYNRDMFIDHSNNIFLISLVNSIRHTNTRLRVDCRPMPTREALIVFSLDEIIREWPIPELINSFRLRLELELNKGVRYLCKYLINERLNTKQSVIGFHIIMIKNLTLPFMMSPCLSDCRGSLFQQLLSIDLKFGMGLKF